MYLSLNFFLTVKIISWLPHRLSPLSVISLPPSPSGKNQLGLLPTLCSQRSRKVLLVPSQHQLRAPDVPGAWRGVRLGPCPWAVHSSTWTPWVPSSPMIDLLYIYSNRLLPVNMQTALFLIYLWPTLRCRLISFDSLLSLCAFKGYSTEMMTVQTLLANFFYLLAWIVMVTAGILVFFLNLRKCF